MRSRRGRPQTSTRQRVEYCYELSVFALPRPRPKVAPNWQPLESAHPMADVSTTWADGSVTKASFKLAITIPRFGGVRFWYVCPSCGRRRGKLYATYADRSYRCRACLGLVYRSQYEKSWRDRFISFFMLGWDRMSPARRMRRLERFLEEYSSITPYQSA